MSWERQHWQIRGRKVSSLFVSPDGEGKALGSLFGDSAPVPAVVSILFLCPSPSHLHPYRIILSKDLPAHSLGEEAR